MATLERVYAAAQRGEHFDLVVRCGGSATPFRLNFAVLAAECGYFATMHSTGIGAATAMLTETSLAECDPDIFALVVRCIYTGALDDVDTGRALDVLALAVFLDCGLCERLATGLIERKGVCFDPDTAVGVWLASSRIDARAARKLAASHLAASMPRAARARAFLTMQKDELVALLSSDEFSAKSEVHVAEALGAWCEANNEQCSALSRVVRFVWNYPAPRDEPTVHGILALAVGESRFRFLTAGHQWAASPVPDLPSIRGTGAAVCNVGASCFTIGGSIYAPVVTHDKPDAWKPYDYGCLRSQVSCAAIGSCIYIAGGCPSGGGAVRPSDDVEILDVASDLRGITRMSRARRMCIAAKSNGALLVAGGFDSIGSALAHAEMIEVTRLRRVKSIPPMLEPRAAAAHATIGENVYVAGGIGALHECVRSAEYFDAERLEWVELPPMPRGRAFCAGAALGHAFYVIGGTENGKLAASFFRFDCLTSEWSECHAPIFGECCATSVHGPS